MQAPGVESGARPMPRDTTIVGTGRDPFTFAPTAKLDVLPVFFPAAIPVLDSELPPAPAVRDAIWNDLAPYANELFYAPLGTRFSNGELNRRHRQRLEAYRAARDTALAGLRSSLPSQSPEGTADTAATSDAQFADLVAQADALRRDLYRGGFAASNGDWNQHRNWRLGEEKTKRTPQELLYDEFSVLRAAIYYQEGLAPEQRHLLREIVTELAEALGDRRASLLENSFAPQHIIYFLPHGSRVRLPDLLPTALARDVAEFTAAKDELKRELRDSLFALDRESASRREKALQDLAAQQAPRLEALEPLAERIRVGLATLADSANLPLAHATLPSALETRITAYLREKSELQRAAQQQAELAPAARGKTSAAASRAALANFEERNRARFAALAAEARAIREEVARAAAASPDSAAKSVDALLADFAAAFKHQQLQALYRDYRVAVLQPGLSPTQRRLLFDAAVAALDLPGVKDWQAIPE